MTFLWLVAVVALIVAAAALVVARKTARRQTQLIESHWQLKYEYGQLSTRLEQLAAASSTATGSPRGQTPPQPPDQAGTSFVPISSLKTSSGN